MILSGMSLAGGKQEIDMSTCTLTCVVVLPPSPKRCALLFCPLLPSGMRGCFAPFPKHICVFVLPPSPQGHDGCCVVFTSFWVRFGFIERPREVLGSSISLLGPPGEVLGAHFRSLGIPGTSSGGSRAISGRPGKVLGGSWGAPGGSLGSP